ncbi:MAG: response regulator transcription factor [Cyanobacteria bacterium SZAS TMP-1]|nr:response regulator transcription factor [Cyanobacteria bacterium SZAS TMP-1]
MAKILYVDDDQDIAEKVQEWLSTEGHVVELASNGEDGLQMLGAFQYDVVLLDWNLPDMTGLEICGQYRRSGGGAWVIFLTGNSAIKYKEAGLDAGADDFVTKPFDIRELSARVRSALRRANTVFQAELKIGNLTLNTSKRTAQVDGGEELHLMPKEAAVLEFLMRHPNKVFGAKALLDAVWPSDSEVSEGTVRTFIKNMRRKLDAAGKPDLIKTVPSLGYTIEKAD